ncbi:MAG: NUDIX domain-containing protein [Candidatus Aenigmarchaeota archaeon]|nr:NUDIX domain-containing protein [Candidatus Aenigmarchaeota archaeon]
MSEHKYPEVTVGALIFNPNSKVLLIKSHKWKGKYTIPGGHIELGETIEDALIREIKEETGLDIYELKFVCLQEFIFDDSFWKKKHFIFLDYVCRANSTDVKLNEEAEDWKWFDLNEALDSNDVENYTKKLIREYKSKFL